MSKRGPRGMATAYRIGDFLAIEILRAGDSIYGDSTQPHLMKCYGAAPAKILAGIHAATKESGAIDGHRR